MEFARNAGWSFVGWSFLEGLVLFSAYFTKSVIPDILILGIYMNIIIGVIWALFSICAFYAVWGLLCGYNQKAWDNYVKDDREATTEGAKRACIEQ